MTDWEERDESTGGKPHNFVLSNEPVPGTEELKVEPVELEANNGLKRMWNRRFKSVMIWVILCVGLLAGERYLGLNTQLVRLMIVKSTWVMGLLIVGLSGTNLMHDWIKKDK